MFSTTKTVGGDHVVECIDLFDNHGTVNPLQPAGRELLTCPDEKLKEVCGKYRGEFAAFGLVENSIGNTVLRAERTLGKPARVACQLVSPRMTRMIVAETIKDIRSIWEAADGEKSWRELTGGYPICRSEDLARLLKRPDKRSGFHKPFDPTYTEMVPAFHRMEIRPWSMRDRRYSWSLQGPPYALYPEQEQLPADTERIGEAYATVIHDVVRDQLSHISPDEPIGVALSGGADSSIVAMVLLQALVQAKRSNPVHALTLCIDGGGTDLAQAQAVVAALDHAFPGRLQWTPVNIASTNVDPQKLMEESALCLEEYHARDVECGMAALLLHRGVRVLQERGDLPSLSYVFDGDGGNECFRDYPLHDDGYGIVSLEDVRNNPHLYYLGYPRSKLAFNPVFSAGLSRAYTRTSNPARLHGLTPCSPLIDRRIVDFSQKLPYRHLATDAAALHDIRLSVTRAAAQSCGVDLPVFPKSRFQEGCTGKPGILRVTQEDVAQLKKMVLTDQTV